jgi:hypothetical protein
MGLPSTPTEEFDFQNDVARRHKSGLTRKETLIVL